MEKGSPKEALIARLLQDDSQTEFRRRMKAFLEAQEGQEITDEYLDDFLGAEEYAAYLDTLSEEELDQLMEEIGIDFDAFNKRLDALLAPYLQDTPKDDPDAQPS